jgi:hypothetical protein
MEIIQQVKDLILQDGLSSKSRQRDKVYKRCYLYSILREQGYGLTETGQLFNRTHATVINALSVHDAYYHIDKVYMRHIKCYESLFHPSVEIPKDSIFDEVMNCHNTTQLRMIKEKIISGGYDRWTGPLI